MVFLGREISEQRNYSEKVAEEIDDEVHGLIDDAYVTAKKILTERRKKLDQMVRVLLEEETLEGEALTALLEAPPDAEMPLAKPEEGTPQKETTEAETPGEEPTVEPKLGKPGLAWEGGQATIRLRDEPSGGE
jgi:cell division protease FtsH